MAKGILYGNVLYKQLRQAVGFASITIRDQQGAKAILFDIDDQTVEIPNPLTTSEYGLFACVIEEGNYNVTASSGGIVKTNFVTIDGFGGGGAISGNAFLVTENGTEYFEVLDIDYGSLDGHRYEAFYSSSASGNGGEPGFVVSLGATQDPYSMIFLNTVTPGLNGSINFAISGTFSITSDSPASQTGTIRLQRDSGSGFTNYATIGSVPEASGDVELSYNDTIGTAASDVYRVFFDIPEIETYTTTGAYSNFEWTGTLL